LEVASFVGTDDSENPAGNVASEVASIAGSLRDMAKEIKRSHSAQQLREYYWSELLDRLPNEPTAPGAATDGAG